MVAEMESQMRGWRCSSRETRVPLPTPLGPLITVSRPRSLEGSMEALEVASE